MNLLILAGLGAGSMAVLWLAQSLLLLRRGDPLVGPLRLRNPPVAVRWTMKVVLQVVLAGMLLGYPMAVGADPLRYHADRLRPARPGDLLEMFLVTLLAFGAGTAVEVTAGWVRLAPRYGPGKTLRKVTQSFLTPLPLAFVEEALFRGIVLDQMVRAVPAGGAGGALAVALSAAIFSAVHFIRRARTYGPALGLFVLGCLLAMAYLAGGRTYWLPVGLHAGGILATQLLRPFAEYRATAWLVGYRDYPLAGGLGILVMILLGVYVMARFPGVASP